MATKVNGEEARDTVDALPDDSELLVFKKLKRLEDAVLLALGNTDSSTSSIRS